MRHANGELELPVRFGIPYVSRGGSIREGTVIYFSPDKKDSKFVYYQSPTFGTGRLRLDSYWCTQFDYPSIEFDMDELL